MNFGKRRPHRMRYLRNVQKKTNEEKAKLRCSPETYRVLESDRLQKRLELMDAFIKKNFRTELYLAKQQKKLPMWKVIEADMSLQEHLVDMEENRLLWKQWNRGNQTEGRPCRDENIPHVCICDQTKVIRKKPQPKPKAKTYSVKSRSNLPATPLQVEEEKCCTRCCKSNPYSDPSPLGSREASLLMRVETTQSRDETPKLKTETTLPKIDSAKSDLSEGNASTLSSSLSGSKQSINRLGQNQSTSSITAVDIHTIPGQRSAKTPPSYAESARSESRVGPGVEVSNKESAISVPSLTNTGIQNYSTSAASPHKTPSRIQSCQLVGLTSFDVAVNTDISYIHKPVVESNPPSSKESSRCSSFKSKPSPSNTKDRYESAKNSSGRIQQHNKNPKMATMAQVYTLAQNTAKAVLARKKSNLENLQTAAGVTSEELDEMEKNDEKSKTKSGKGEQNRKSGKGLNRNKLQKELSSTGTKETVGDKKGTGSENLEGESGNQESSGSENQDTSGDSKIESVDQEATNEDKGNGDEDPETGKNMEQEKQSDFGDTGKSDQATDKDIENNDTS